METHAYGQRTFCPGGDGLSRLETPTVTQGTGVGAVAAGHPKVSARVSPWNRTSLQAKISLVILLIVGLSAVSDEYLDRRYVADLARANFQEELTAVVR